MCQLAIDINVVDPAYTPSLASSTDGQDPTQPNANKPTTTNSTQLMLNVMRRKPSKCSGSGSSVTGLRNGSTTSSSVSSSTGAASGGGGGVCSSMERALFTIRSSRCHSGSLIRANSDRKGVV